MSMTMVLSCDVSRLPALELDADAEGRERLLRPFPRRLLARLATSLSGVTVSSSIRHQV